MYKMMAVQIISLILMKDKHLQLGNVKQHKTHIQILLVYSFEFSFHELSDLAVVQVNLIY